jgi:ribosomal protein L30/L7E
MDNDEIIKKHKRENTTLGGYFMPTYNSMIKMFNEARASERAKIIKMLEIEKLKNINFKNVAEAYKEAIRKIKEMK